MRPTFTKNAHGSNWLNPIPLLVIFLWVAIAVFLPLSNLSPAPLSLSSTVSPRGRSSNPNALSNPAIPGQHSCNSVFVDESQRKASASRSASVGPQRENPFILPEIVHSALKSTYFGIRRDGIYEFCIFTMNMITASLKRNIFWLIVGMLNGM